MSREHDGIKKRPSKIRKLMLSQTAEQNSISSTTIQELMRGDLKSVIDYNMRKYGKNIERRMGYDRDDMMGVIMEQVWKGLLTHRPDGKASLKTYMTTLIANKFKGLLTQTQTKKHSSLDFYLDPFSAGTVDPEFTETKETSETILEQRQELLIKMTTLESFERKIYDDLVLGFSLTDISKRSEMNVRAVTAVINNITLKLKGSI